MYVWASCFVAVAVSVALIGMALTSGDIVGAVVTAIVPTAALVRSVSNSRSDVPVHLAILVVILLLLVGIWSRSASAVVFAALLGVSLGGAEVYRRFRLLNRARQRWLAITSICRQEGARIVWISHASPRGEKTEVALIDPATGRETHPKSLWGTWTSRQYACVTAGRRVLATARSGDPQAVDNWPNM